MDGDKLEWALRWARKGFRIFPLRPGSKKPRFEGWTETATGNEDQIRAWWAEDPRYNIGVLTNELVVVDIDVKKGKDGLASFAALDLSFDDQDTLTTESPSGGRHAYYTGPNRTLSVGRLGDGLDIRSFHGYVVGPGSYIDERVDPTAGCSGWYRVVNDVPVRTVPREILTKLDAPIDRAALGVDITLDTPAAVDQAVFFLANEAPPAVEGEGGDLATLKAALWCKDLGLSADMTAELMAEHYLPRCTSSYSFDSMVEWVKDKVANAYAFGSKAIGAASPEAAFSGVYVPPVEPVNTPPAVWFRHGDAWDRNASWLYYEMIPASGVGVLTGPSQAGKTFVLTDLARSLATGKPFFDVVPDEPGGTIFLFAGTEGSGFERRLEALGEGGHLPISSTRVAALGQRGALTTLLDQVRGEAERMQKIFGVPLRLLVLETLSASGLLEDEDSNAEAAQAISNLAQLGQFLGVPVITSHHPPKGGHGSRGAGAIINNADFHIEVSRIGRENVRTVDLAKARNAPQRKLGTYSLVPVELGEDDRGRKIISMILSAGKPTVAAASLKESHSALVVECIDWICIENPVDIDGARAAPFDDVHDLFKDRKPGSKDRGNISRVWTASLQFAIDSGAVEDLAHGGERYLRKREFN